MGGAIRFHGPYRIAEVLDDDNYKLRDLHSRRLLEDVNVERLTPYPTLTNHGDIEPSIDAGLRRWTRPSLSVGSRQIRQSGRDAASRMV